MSRANPPPTAREKIMANAIRVLLTVIDGADEQKRHYARTLGNAALGTLRDDEESLRRFEAVMEGRT